MSDSNPSSSMRNRKASFFRLEPCNIYVRWTKGESGNGRWRRALARFSLGAGDRGVIRGKVFGGPRENFGADGRGEHTLVLAIGVGSGSVGLRKVFGGPKGESRSGQWRKVHARFSRWRRRRKCWTMKGTGGGEERTLVSALGVSSGGIGLRKVFGGPRDNLGAGGGGERTLVLAVSGGSGGVGLGKIFGGPRRIWERAAEESARSFQPLVPLAVVLDRKPVARTRHRCWWEASSWLETAVVAAAPAQCRSRPCGRSEATKVRVKGPQCSSASHAARRHARGMGHPVKKAASRSCLQRPSVSSDSQQMPESVCGPPGKMLSNVSDRRAGVD
uniref:Uncharacterized protein n=1 Tax=Oryza glumipatula TaxID=40148 RepID=A0A0D9ZPY2_9ORYZ